MKRITFSLIMAILLLLCSANHYPAIAKDFCFSTICPSAPAVMYVPESSNNGTYVIRWEPPTFIGSIVYTLIESSNPKPTNGDSTLVYHGVDLNTTITGKTNGTYYYTLYTYSIENGYECSFMVHCDISSWITYSDHGCVVSLSTGNYNYLTLDDTFGGSDSSTLSIERNVNNDNNYVSNKESQYRRDSRIVTHALYPWEYYTQITTDQRGLPTLRDPLVIPPPNDTRQPLILIHGWQGDEPIHQDQIQLNATPYLGETYWSNFIKYCEQSDLKDKYRLYIYHYPSYKHITFNARVLSKLLQENEYIKNRVDEGKNIAIVAHSMGGLVARSLIEEHLDNTANAFGKKGIDIIDRLVTLATPHHGAPASMYWWIMSTDLSTASWTIKDMFSPGTQDLFWDNYDRVFTPLFNSQPTMSTWGPCVPKSTLANLISPLIYPLLSDNLGWGCTPPTNIDLNNSGRLNENSSFDAYYRSLLSVPDANPIYQMSSPSGTMNVYRYPNPWLKNLNDKLLLETTQNQYHLYSGKYVFLSGYNENSNFSLNNLLNDRGIQGFADTITKKMGYINDWVVTTTSGALDLSFESSNSEFNSAYNSGKISLIPEFTDNISYKVINYGTVNGIPIVLFKDYHHDRMLNGAYANSDQPSDLQNLNCSAETCECEITGRAEYIGCGGFKQVTGGDLTYGVSVAKLYHDQSSINHSNFTSDMNDSALRNSVKLRYEPVFNVINKALRGLTTYTISVSESGIGGTVFPVGSHAIMAGAKETFKVVPDWGYQAEINGTCPQGTQNGTIYTTGIINSDCTLQVSFSQPTPIVGKIIGLFQGPVMGATVFADCISGEGVRNVLDIGEISTTTDSKGKFVLSSNLAYQYLLVSKGGIDTLTGMTAIQMLAPADVNNVTPLTTLVTLDTTGNVKAKLEALLGNNPYDTDISQNVTQAALFLTKAVEFAVKSLTASITVKAGSGAISDSQLSSIQVQIVQAIAQELAKANVTTSTISTPASLKPLIETALTNAISKINVNGGNITIPTSSATALASDTVDAAANFVGFSGTATVQTNFSNIAQECSYINETVVSNYQFALDSWVNTIFAAIVALPTPDAYNPPVIIDSIPCLMGGSIQCTALNLTSANALVTTLAGTTGSSGSADGTGTTARFNSPAGITTDGTYLYVTDRFNHIIRKIVIASGVVTTLAGTTGSSGSADGTGTTARFNYPAGITTDGVNLYVADTGNNTIRKIAISTGVVTTLAGMADSGYGSADGIGSAARFYSPFAITTDGLNLYVADTFNQTIRKIVIATGVVTTLAGIAESPGSADGIGASARFNSPDAITTDGANLYVGDYINNMIRKIVIATKEVTTLTGTVGGIEGVTSDGTYVYSAEHYVIRNIAISTGAVTTLAGLENSYGFADGMGAVARFKWATGITNDGTNLYVADTGNHTIRKISKVPDTTLPTITGMTASSPTNNLSIPITITASDNTGGSGVAAYLVTTSSTTPDNMTSGWSIANSFNYTVTADGTYTLYGWAKDAAGNVSSIYSPVSVTVDRTIPTTTSTSPADNATDIAVGNPITVTFNKSMDVSTINSSTFKVKQGSTPVEGTVSYDTTTMTASFTPSTALSHSTTYTITLAGMKDSAGNPITSTTQSFMTQTNSNPCLMGGSMQCTELNLTLGNISVTTVAGSVGISGFSDGTGSTAKFNQPFNITTDGTDLYITDRLNHTIRKIVIATGEVTTFAGSPGVSGSNDGVGVSAKFYRPTDITTDGINLFLVDGNCTIRKIDISTGLVTTLAGSPGVCVTADGIGSEARFYHPLGITTDGSNLYLTDVADRSVRKILISTAVVSTFARSFSYPYSITTDGICLYVADTDNRTIKKIIITTGEVTAFAGSPGVSGSKDGVGSAATFDFPSRITTDGVYLYVNDASNIRKIVISSGLVTTIAAIESLNLYGITTDGTSLYVTDDNNIIRKISAAVVAPTLSTPVNGATGQATNVSVTWLDTNSSPQESSYKVRIKPSGGSYIEFSVAQDATSCPTSGLIAGETYYWSVKAVGNGMSTLDSAYPTDRSFTVAGATLNAPTLSSPADGAMDQPTNVSVTWTDTNSSPQETVYKVRIKPSGGSYAEYSAVQNATSYSPPGLATGTKYYWSAKAVGDGASTLDSAYPAERSFTIAGVLLGDVNNDGIVTIADAILACQVMSSMSTTGQTIASEADVNSDENIGLAEVIYILQKESEIR